MKSSLQILCTRCPGLHRLWGICVLLFVSACAGVDDSAGPNGVCADPNFTATVEDVASFKACDAYAYEVMSTYGIIGNSGEDWVTLGFLTADQSAIVPGIYVVNNGASVPSGQAMSVDFVYKEGALDLAHTYLSTTGTLELVVADGAQYQGTFSGSATQMEDSTDSRAVSGAFDVDYR